MLHPVGGQTEGRGIDSESAFWRQFAEATTPTAFCQSWLPLQCRMLKGVRCGMVLLGNPDQGPFSPAAVWPDAKLSMDHLTGAAERALKERRGLLLEGDSSLDADHIPQETYHVAYPIEVSGRLHGVVVLEVERSPRREVQAVMRQLHWGAAWLEVMVNRTETLQAKETNERLQKALDLTAAALQEERFQAAASAFVTRLAARLDCDRVSIGFVEGKKARVRALSHSAQFRKEMNLIRAVGAAMDESIDQKTLLVYPSTAEDPQDILRAHRELAKRFLDGAVCTVPFLDGKGKGYGALTLERSNDQCFDEQTLALCETIAAFIGPVLEEKRRNDRLIVLKMKDALLRQLERLLGPGYILRKLIAAAAVGLALFFCFATGAYRVTAPTTIEGRIRRSVVAPYEGYISSAPVRAGDVVEAGQLMCSLDDRDLRLERLKWLSQRNELTHEFRKAMAEGDNAKVKILAEQIKQAEARMALLDEQLSRVQIAAPFRGVVVSGDLSQSLGAPVEKGQILYEVAPLESYRVKLQVDEREIGAIKVAQKGDLVLTAMPKAHLTLTVEKITPVSMVKEGRNYFVVEAQLEKAQEGLRPGMEGFAKISVDRRKLAWIWTHELIDWVRLKLWSWLP